MTQDRIYRAGQSIEDYCRACKADRSHAVIVVDSNGKLQGIVSRSNILRAFVQSQKR